MVCQSCKQRHATTRLTHTVNGKTTELFLCRECAASHQRDLLSGTALNVGNLFGGLFAAPSLRENEEQEYCSKCQKSFREIVQSGVVGCPDCYIQFYDRLQPSIQRIHGKTSHVGKVAAVGSAESRVKQELVSLKEELSKALTLQEYERCAQLRDRIKELEGETHD